MPALPQSRCRVMWSLRLLSAYALDHLVSARVHGFDRPVVLCLNDWQSNHSMMRARGVKVQFFFGNHKLDTGRRELHRGSHPVAVEPQVFDLLRYLVENRDRVVSKDDLIASVWGGRNVSDSTLSSRINAARRAIGDNGDEQKQIRTVPRRGVRFVGDVSIAPVQSEAAPIAAQRP